MHILVGLSDYVNGREARTEQAGRRPSKVPEAGRPSPRPRAPPAATAAIPSGTERPPRHSKHQPDLSSPRRHPGPRPRSWPPPADWPSRPPPAGPPRLATSTSPAIRTCRSRPSSTGSSPTRSTPAVSTRARGCPPCASSGAALRVNPNTVRAVYRRLADAGYVGQPPGRRDAGRGARRRGAARPAPWTGSWPSSSGPAARAGYSRRRGGVGGLRRRDASGGGPGRGPRPLRRVHVGRRAARRGAHQRGIRGDRGGRRALIETVARAPGRSSTTTSSRRRPSTPTRRWRSSPAGRPVVALLAAPSYAELLDEIGALPRAASSVSSAPRRSTANMEDWLAAVGRRHLASSGGRRRRGRLGRRRPEADLLLLTREALEIGLAAALRPPGADPRMDLRPRSRRARAPAAGDRRGCGPTRSPDGRDLASSSVGLTDRGGSAGSSVSVGRPCAITDSRCAR